jgi:uncharacterized cupredoxin-like copper-binding protein
MDQPLEARPNELIRLWVVDAGPTLWSAFHVIGALFDHVYPSGNPTNSLNGLQTWSIGPGDGAMFELRIPDAGLYPFVTHSFAYTGRGAVGVLKVDPSVGPAPTSYPLMGDPFSGGVLEMGPTPSNLAPPVSMGGMADMPGMGSSSGGSSGSSTSTPPAQGASKQTITISNVSYSVKDFNVKEGSVTIELVNQDPMQHDFTIDALGLKIVVPASSTASDTFTVKPGTYEFYCSIPGHKQAGMFGTMTVLPGAGH